MFVFNSKPTWRSSRIMKPLAGRCS